MIRFLKSRYRRSKSSEDGSVTIEMLLMMPLLVWSVVATIVYFDGFRSRLMLQKSTSTIADSVSRVLVTIGPDYVDGMSDLFEVLTPTVTDRGLRITQITYDEDEDEYLVVWSSARGTFSNPMVDSDLIGAHSKMPLMADDDRYIVVETKAEYSNALSSLFGPILTNISLGDAITIAPRLEDAVCFVAPDEGADIC